jgi:hypothetical protein
VAPDPERERDCELRARALLEAEFGCALKKIPEVRMVETADYLTVDGSRSVEVKRITSEAYNDLRSAASRTDWSYDSLILSGRWTVMINQLTLSDILKPMPKFPADDPEASAEAEAFDFRLIPRHEQEAEWRASYPGPKQDTPRLKDLGPDLERHLHVLEQHAIYSTRGAGSSEPDAWQALNYIANRTGNAICLWRELIRDEKPGINLALASGYNRTARADTVVGRIELWLASKQGSNLRKSLANEPNTEHHAVLVFDRYTEPEHQTAIEQGINFCPIQELQLPDEIDVLWFIIGPVACRFSTSLGWRALPMPTSAA